MKEKVQMMLVICYCFMIRYDYNKSMLINLKGKTALVTGSLEGIGKGIADALVKAGANMILHGFGSEDLIDQRLR